MEIKALSSEFLRKRGNCCKSNCLHCPYGTTLRNFGVVVERLKDDNQLVIKDLVELLVQTDSLTSSLLSGAFGNQKKYELKDACLLTLKDIPCGVAYVQNKKLLKHFLRDEFSDQGITSEYIEGLLI